MDPKTRQRRTIGLVGLTLAIASCGAYMFAVGQAAEVTATGRVVAIDLANRVATLEFVHRRTGAVRTAEGAIADNCEILIDGAPAAEADVRVGDEAEVHVRVSRLGFVTVDRVHILRDRDSIAGAAPPHQPATVRRDDSDEPTEH